MSSEQWICDGCMAQVSRDQIADMADGEHVICRSCRPAPGHKHTPRRSVRVSEDLWQAAQACAQEKGETVTDVLVRALKRYVR